MLTHQLFSRIIATLWNGCIALIFIVDLDPDQEAEAETGKRERTGIETGIEKGTGMKEDIETGNEIVTEIEIWVGVPTETLTEEMRDQEVQGEGKQFLR